LSLDRLARLAHFSVFHFHRIFKALAGEPVGEYVRRLRLEAAAVALKSTRQSVLEVALAAGYGTHEAFTRAFGQMFGVSPVEFRDGHNPLFNRKETTPMTALENLPEVRIQSLPARRVAFLRHLGPFETAGPTFTQLFTWAARRNLIRPDTLAVGICPDDPEITPPEKVRFDCCLTVPNDVKPEGDVGVQTIAAGEHAVLTHRGPYDRLGDVYRWLYGVWLPTSGREPGDAPPFEVYRNSPGETPPEDLLTDVCIPLEPR
jgi:AraC family transcriptional regulator